MRNSIISLLIALGVIATPALADNISIRKDAPSRYVVKKGDTLWGISGRYLSKPWHWPRLWQMNRKEIKNPYLIYPGDELILEWVNGRPRLRRAGGNNYSSNRVVKLSPQIRVEEDNSIQSIPREKIEPFLFRSRIVDRQEFNDAPEVLAGDAKRVVLSKGDRVYTTGITEAGVYQAFRAQRQIIDPDTKEPLGFEIIYNGDLNVDKLGEPVQSLRVLSSTEEIQKGDHLFPRIESQLINFTPHPVESDVKGKILSAYGGVQELAKYSNVLVNKGTRDGLEVGHVFTIKNAPRTIDTGKKDKNGYPVYLALPQETLGSVFIYRVFDRASYGIIMENKDVITVGDWVVPPSDDD